MQLKEIFIKTKIFRLRKKNLLDSKKALTRKVKLMIDVTNKAISKTG